MVAAGCDVALPLLGADGRDGRRRSAAPRDDRPRARSGSARAMASTRIGPGWTSTSRKQSPSATSCSRWPELAVRRCEPPVRRLRVLRRATNSCQGARRFSRSSIERDLCLMRLLPLCPLLALDCLAALAQSPQAARATRPRASRRCTRKRLIETARSAAVPDAPVEERTVSDAHHSVARRAAGRCKYTATAGTLTIRDNDGQAEGEHLLHGLHARRRRRRRTGP